MEKGFASQRVAVENLIYYLSLRSGGLTLIFLLLSSNRCMLSLQVKTLILTSNDDCNNEGFLDLKLKFHHLTRNFCCTQT